MERLPKIKLPRTVSAKIPDRRSDRVLIVEGQFISPKELILADKENTILTGRQKDMFNSYGINVYPEVIEHDIIQHKDVIDGRVACFGIFNNGTNDIHICVESNNKNIGQELIQLIHPINNKIDSPKKLYRNSFSKYCLYYFLDSFLKNG